MKNYFTRYDAKEMYQYFLKAFNEKRYKKEEFKDLDKAFSAFLKILSPIDKNTNIEDFKDDFLEWLLNYPPQQKIDRCLATLRQIRCNRKNDVKTIKLNSDIYDSLKTFSVSSNISIQDAILSLLSNNNKQPVQNQKSLEYKNNFIEDVEQTDISSTDDEISSIDLIVSFSIERNSKFVRGKKNAIRSIQYFLEDYVVKKIDDTEYILRVDYEDIKDLKEIVQEIESEIHSIADGYDCFIDCFDITPKDKNIDIDFYED